MEQSLEVLSTALHGVFKHLGPIGAALDWILAQAQNVTAVAWKAVLEVMDAAGKGVHTILDWAKAKSSQVLGQVVAALNAAGNVIATVIDWTKTAGDAAIQVVSGVLFRAGQTVGDILLWVEKDALGSLQLFVKGLLTAGAAVADLVLWAASRTIKIAGDVVTELIASGATMAQLVADTLAHPGDATKNLMAAFADIGKTFKEIVESAIVQPAEDAAKKALATLKELGKSALEVLQAAAEISLSALGTAFTLILEWFPGSYRPLSTTELTAAQAIFASSIPLDQVRLAVMSIPVDVIEWIEQEVTGQPGRAFTTMTLINFPSWENLPIWTVMHELTHVWQNFQVGPIYMVEALEAQFSKAAYDYGYGVDGNQGLFNGEGAQSALVAANGNYNSFNREQQAMIIQHYWVRKYGNPTYQENGQTLVGQAEYTEWQPYANLVHSGPVAAAA
jgi:hypothetical protein